MDSSIFDFSLCGEPTDDVVDVEDVELRGNSNPHVSTNADVIDVQDDTVVEVGQNTENRLKRKVPPQVPKPKKEPGKRYRSPFWDHFNEIKENQFCHTKSKGKVEGERMEKQVKDVLNRLYDSYAKEGELRQNVPSASSMPRGMEENEDCDHRLNLAMEFDTYLEEEYSSVCSSEVDKYLGDLCERRDIPDFDIWVWWKTNSNKYPILSKLARDVLAVPVSTVASESAFSTGGRVLDPFRSSLSPSMVETLVCTQNWLLSTVPISLRQAMDKVEDFERGLNGHGKYGIGSGSTPALWSMDYGVGVLITLFYYGLVFG
ncbi:hypothetical protein RHGRI_004337 [Rhododendron griersonianum]|uniref:HAT C-terminal dimerisation domain-containing protein n=1 Tax=Rhododendron griersonianum TaxID=479676 RepID=A0AAV6LA08_9ERIC|nr:hypothetical protein RHGRI_004337 [Rhododendron griersonianum]